MALNGLDKHQKIRITERETEKMHSHLDDDDDDWILQQVKL